jgi:hypothetical protein
MSCSHEINAPVMHEFCVNHASVEIFHHGICDVERRFLDVQPVRVLHIWILHIELQNLQNKTKGNIVSTPSCQLSSINFDGCSEQSCRKEPIPLMRQ